MRLFLLDPALTETPAPGAVVRLAPEETKHLVRVLRTPPGSRVLLADGRGRFLDGELTGVRAGRAELVVRAVREDPRETRPPRLELICGVVKGARFAQALEKAVELGAHAVRPLVAARSVVEPGAARAQRWQALARAAAKQAGRALVPLVHAPADLEACLSGLDGGVCWYGEEAARDGAPASALQTPLTLGELLAAPPPAVPVLAWAVGPEGGWSDEERRLLAGAGARPVRLGPHRLRTETAAAAGLLLLMALREAAAPPGGAA